LQDNNKILRQTSSISLFGILGLAASILMLSLLLFTDAVFAQEASERQPVQIISEIRSLLNQTIKEYKKQNYTGAENLAIEAYLENYEFIESNLAKHDKKLMEETEVMLREQLRQLINNKAPSEEVQHLIDKINNNLDQAEKLLLPPPQQ
jgi:hypothetical protein